jgi:hypothetical protein
MPSVNVSGVGIVNFPDGMSPEDITRVIENEILPAAQRKPAERTFGEAATDIYAGLKGGFGSLLQLPSQITGVVGGEYEKPGEETGLAAVGKELRTEAEAMKSPGLKAREAARAAKVAEAEKKGQLDAFFTAFSETLRDPALLTSFLAEQAPQLLPSLGAARLVAPLAGTTAAVRAAVGTGAVQQGADIAAGTYEQVYKELIKKGVSETEAAGQALGLARLNGVGATGLSILSQRLPGARALEEAFAGKKGELGRILGGAKAAAGEAVSEVAEETPARFLQNLAMAQVAPETSLTAGLGETAAMAALGGAGLGGAAGLLQRQAPREAVPPATTIPSQFAATPEPEPEAGPPLLLEDKGVFRPVGLPDGTVAMTREDLARYEEEQFRKKYEPQPVATLPPEAPVPPVAEEERPLSFATATQEIAALKGERQTPEVRERIRELQAYKMDLLMDQMRRAQQPVRPELVELRRQMESGALSADRIDEVMDAVMADLREKKPPKAAEQAALEKEIAGTEKDVAKELAELKKESLAKSKEASKLGTARGEEYNLGTFLKNKLTRDDVIDINPEKSFAKKYLAPKNVVALELADMVADGKLDAWLPPNMRTESETFDEKDATEYIKEQLRQGEFRVYDAQNQQRLLGEEVSRIDERIKQLEAAKKAIKELPQMTAEERQQEAAALAAEAGFQGAPEEVANIPEEQEEYFPDQEEVRGRLAEKEAREVIPELADVGITPQMVELYRKYDEASKRPNVMSSEGIPSDKANLTRTFKKLYAQLETLEKPSVALQRLASLSVNGVDNLYTDKKPKRAEEREAFVINKNKEHERIEKELTGKDMLGVARWAIDNAPNKFAQALAQKVFNRLNGMSRRGIKMEFKIASGDNRPFMMRNARGVVDFDFGKAGEGKQPVFRMTLNGAAVLDNQNGYPPGMRYITVLHELLHVATVGQISVLKSSDPIVKELNDLFNQVVRHFNAEVRAGRLTPFMEKVYGREINALESPDELLAWGIADEDMQRFLSDIKVGEKTIMDKLVELIRKILNVTKPYLTALDQLVRTTESILDEDVNVVGDKIISRQYSFGVKPGGQPVQGTLFEKAGPSLVSKAAKKVAEKIEGVGKKPGLTPEQGFGHVDPNYLEKLKPFFAPEGKTFADKMETYKDRTFQRLAQGIADQYRTIKDYSPLAYIKARMSKTVDGALEGLTFYGQVKLTDGALDIKPDTKGLIKTLEPIGNEVNSFLIWLALNRDAALVERGRIASISPEIVEERNKLATGKIGDKSRLEVYEDIRKELNKLNKSVLDVALQQGLIDKKSYDTFLKDVYYIPFYKMVEEGEVADIRTASGLANKYFSKALKGGEKPFGDLMENLLRNWNHILSSSMKNDAAVETIKAATEAGAAYPNLKVQFQWKDGQVYSRKSGKPIPAGEVDNIKYAEGELRPGLYSSDGKGLVKVMMNGYPAYYEVIDPLLVESIMSIGYMGPKSKFLDMARDFKNILQYGVTLSPAFKVRNLIRDSVQSAAISPIGLNIGKNVTEGLAASKKGNPDYISALAGGAIFNFGSYMEGDQARQVKRLIKQGVNPDNILNTEAKIKNGLKKMYDAYQELGNRSEAANRMALYKQLRAKGLSHLEASFQARDLLDFSMQGAWPAVRLVTQVIPFLNARIQGLYKLGRDGIIPTSRVLYNSVTGKPLDLTDKQKAQQFSIVTGATVLASLMLYMAFKDDDEFKKREQWDRDNFWWFRLPGMEAAIRIPKPFEIGAMGTFAERIAEQMFDEGAEGRVFEQSMKRMLTDTFAINPIPQMIKPLVDLYANKDSFTGAPIETAGMERLSKAERVAVNTSPLAKALSQVANVFLPEATEVSPVQTDYAIKAYLGWMGATISATSHYAVMPFSKSAYPDHNWTDTMSLGFVRTLPANQSGYVTSFYENMKTIEQAYADMRHYAELGQAEKVQQILEEKGDKIQLAKFYDKTSKDMAKVRQAIQVIQRDETMDGAQKREEIDRLKQLIGDLAKQAEDVRKSLRQ